MKLWVQVNHDLGQNIALRKNWRFSARDVTGCFLITCVFKCFPLLASWSRVKQAAVSTGGGQKPNVCERKSYKIGRRRNFYLENILWLKLFCLQIFALNCMQLVLWTEKKTIQFCAWILFSSAWWEQRLPNKDLIGDCQAPCIFPDSTWLSPVSCPCASAEQLAGCCRADPAQRVALLATQVSLVRTMGREKGKLTPQKQSLKSDRTNTSQVVWRCGKGL